jgi:hypothetical protein
MKTFSAILFAAILVPALSFAQASAKFAKNTHDFGTIQQGGDGTTQFEFTNTGKEPLVISNAVGSCGCTVPEWPKEPILPGKKAAIKVKYDTNRVGNFTKTVTVTMNTEPSTETLTITGNVKANETPATQKQEDHSGHGH